MLKLVFILLILQNALAAEFRPLIKSGEIKITYPCDVVGSLDLEGEEREVITFFDTPELTLFEKGFVIRKRHSVTENDGDFTVKYRTKESPDLNRDVFDTLSTSNVGDFKCEYDMTYKPPGVESTAACSFKTETESPMKEHSDLIQMTKKPLPEWDESLSNYHQFTAISTSWKLVNSDRGPFKKKISVEKWLANNECRLEVSGKVEFTNVDTINRTNQAIRAFAFLKGLINAQPSEKQGRKTEWVLGIKDSGTR